MKKNFLYLIAAVLLSSCMSTTKITGAWKNPQQPGKTYSSIFIACLTSNSIARATIENDIASALEKHGISAYKSMDEFPPGIKKDSLTKEDIMKRMKSKKSDGILTISLIRKETESRYVPEMGGPYAPFPRYPYYADFWGYYSYWYPYVYNPGYYEQNKIYYLEANLYDAGSELLVWSAQSRTYNPTGIQEFSAEFSKIIVSKLKEDGMLKPAGSLSTIAK